jgi:hypothetical protein
MVAAYTPRRVVALSGQGPPLACASLLKPLYAWVAPRTPNWPDLARAAVTASDNAATTALVGAAGGLEAVLAALEQRSGVHWEAATSWGRVRVTAEQVACAYAALLAADDAAAGAVRELMRQVPPGQTFGVPATWTASSRVPAEPAELIGAKAGWDLDVAPERDAVARTHVVLTAPGGGFVALTAVPVTEDQARQWTVDVDRGGPSAALATHDRWAGAALRRAARQAARHLGSDRRAGPAGNSLASVRYGSLPGTMPDNVRAQRGETAWPRCCSSTTRLD